MERSEALTYLRTHHVPELVEHCLVQLLATKPARPLPFLHTILADWVPLDPNAPQPSPTESSPTDTPPLYLAARAGNTRQLLQLLDGQPPPNLFSSDPRGSLPLHGAAWAQSPACVAVLMDRHMALDRNFDPKSVQNKFGETPIDSAGVHQQCLDVLQQRPDNARYETAPICLPDHLKKQAFVCAVAESPLIGDRHLPFSRKECPLAAILEGLVREEREYFETFKTYDQWLKKRDDCMSNALPTKGSVFWRTHFSAEVMGHRLMAAWVSVPHAAVFREAVFLYTTESFLCPAINAALRLRDTTKTHLVPFLRLLHCALRAFPEAQRHPAAAYRAIHLTEAQRATLELHPADTSHRYITFDGFASATLSAQKAFEGLQEDGWGVLLVMTPADPTNPSCCPVRIADMSAFPQEEEVLYPLGQQFEVMARGHKSLEEVREWLAVPLPLQRPSHSVFVVELRAVDLFWGMAEDAYVDGGTAAAAEVVLQRRLDADLRTHGPKHPVVAEGYYHLARQQCCVAQYDSALTKHQKALAIRLAALVEGHPDVADSYFSIADVRYAKAEYDAALDMHQKALHIRIAALGDDHPDVANSYNNMGLVYESKTDLGAAFDMHQKALHIRIAALGPDHPRVGASYNNIASVYKSKGDYATALDMHQQALSIRIATLGEDHPDVGASYNNMAIVYYLKGDYAAALDMHEKALRIIVTALGEAHPDVGNLYNNIALVHKSKGEYDAALDMHQKALRIRIVTLGEDHPHVGASYNNMAVVCDIKGDYDTALDMHQKALRIRIAALGEDHPDVGISYNNIAVGNQSKGDYDAALDMHKKALGIQTSALGEDHPDVGTSYNNMAIVYDVKGDYDVALDLHQKALCIRIATLGEDHPDVGNSYNNMGLVYKSKGEHDAALDMHHKALRIATAALGKCHPDVGASYNNIARVYYSKGEYDAALDMHQKALRIRIAALGEDHPHVGASYNNMAVVYQSKGEFIAAAEMREKARICR